MQYRRSRTVMPRASPFAVRSFIETTLLTVVLAGLQRALGYRGRARSLLVCLIPADLLLFRTGQHSKKTTPEAPGLVPARYYLERQTTASPNGPRWLGVLA